MAKGKILISSEIQFIGTDGIARTGTLLPTDVHGDGLPWQHTDDPDWVFTVRDTGDVYRGEWLGYTAGDGRLWRAKVHCRKSTLVRAGIECWFEHVQVTDGDDEHDSNVLNYRRWDGGNGWARILPVRRPFPASPKFELWVENPAKKASGKKAGRKKTSGK